MFVDTGSYAGAADLAAEEFMREKLLGSDADDGGRLLMSLHKAKGREFDVVVIVDGPTPRDRLVLGVDSLDDNFPRSRRLLHMAITRARTCATLLTPQWNPCPILPAL